MPLPTNIRKSTHVDVIFRNGSIVYGKSANYWIWAHINVGCGGDIVEYRIHGTDTWYKWNGFNHKVKDSIDILEPDDLPV